MANQTLVSVPTKFEELKQVRAFTVKLVEKLDIVLGFRGSIGYEEAGTAQVLAETTLASLANTVEEFESVLDTLRDELDLLSESLNQYKTGTAIADTTYTAPTISAAYSQSEVQDIADQLETVSDKLDTLFAALRGVEILDP